MFRSALARRQVPALPARLLVLAVSVVLVVPAQAAAASRGGARTITGPLASDPIVMARAAFERHDRAGLVTLRNRLAADAHPLAMWADYWELSLRLRSAKQADLDAFYARWPGTAVEDRLRRDWIVERGKHRDMEVLATEVPRVTFFDDREVECYALLMRHQAGEAVSERARELWFAQREADHGCALLVEKLFRANQLTRDDLWARARLAAEQGRRYPAQHALGLLREVKAETVHQVFLQPAHFLARRSARPSNDEGELTILAVIRLSARHPKAAATALADARSAQLPPLAVASAWAILAKEAAMNGLPEALDWYQRSAAAAGTDRLELTPDALAWQVRAALRAEGDAQRWPAIIAAVDAMGSAQRTDPTWTYWKARALKASAAPGIMGDAQRRAAKQLFESIAANLHFYGRLASEELGLPRRLPDPPPVLTDAERAAALENPSLTRGLALLERRLRDEGQAEWQHGLRGMNDRTLRAAAQRACDAEVWNLCMSTSERTRVEIDMAQRYPTPFRDAVEAAARESDLDAAQVYAVIRQESHFSVGVRSVAGASGLMQVMPRTATWIASRYRIPFRRDLIADPAINVRIGARYLKLVLRDFGGSHALAAAAYNAGPSRPRRWRNVVSDDAVAWTEIIPIGETRDYVKGVLVNVAYYSALIGGDAIAKLRLSDAMRLRPAELTLAETREQMPDDLDEHR
jgi:soluble lytic murein transglycosylase